MASIKKIYVDLDNTFWDSISAIVSMYNEDYRYYLGYTPIKPEDIKTWKFKEFTCCSYDESLKMFTSGRFFDRVKPFEGAVQVLKSFSKDYEIIFVSFGQEPNLRGKANWLEKNIPFKYKFIGLNHKKYEDKSCVDMSDGIFIDDHIKYLAGSNAKIKICFGKEYEWNRSWDGKRCLGWKEVYDSVNEIIARENLLKPEDKRFTYLVSYIDDNGKKHYVKLTEDQFVKFFQTNFANYSMLDDAFNFGLGRRM